MSVKANSQLDMDTAAKLHQGAVGELGRMHGNPEGL